MGLFDSQRNDMDDTESGDRTPLRSGKVLPLQSEAHRGLSRDAEADKSHKGFRADVEEALRDLGVADGFPEIRSLVQLGEFKRVLTNSQDGVINITPEARSGFVAVDLQAGLAWVIATREFRETAQYASYLLDLERVHIDVREEMVASKEIIASIYNSGRASKTHGISNSNSSQEISVFRDIVEAGHRLHATDVHFELRNHEREAAVRFRVHGDLYTYERLPRGALKKSLAAAYQDLVQANTNSGSSFQETGPQSAMIPLIVGKDRLNLRWQSSNLNGGLDVALRLLDGNFKNYKVLSIEDMGWAPSQCEILYGTTRASDGLTINCGPTGSGKTTLQRALAYSIEDRDLRKQFAISEPSEYPQPWLSDISIQRRPGESEASITQTYAEVIRTILRMDPDDLTIAEIRDRVVAGLVMELALTGHPTRTTVHARSLVEIFMRLMGDRLQIPADEITSGIVNAAISQRLVPVLCECAHPARNVMPDEQLIILEKKFGLDTRKMRCRNEDGCERCRLEGLVSRNGKVAAGTVGVTVVGEAYVPTVEFLEKIGNRDWRGAEKVYRLGRQTRFDDPDMTGKTMFEHALYKASGNDRHLIDPRLINSSFCSFNRYRIEVIPGIDLKEVICSA